MVSPETAADWRARQTSFPALSLDGRSLADLEMLAIGGFSPLKGFMVRADYDSVIDRMRLADGSPWTIPITLAVSREEAGRFKEGKPVGLLEGSRLIAVLHLKEKYEADRSREAMGIYRTRETAHPGVNALFAQGDVLLGGNIEVFDRPSHADFPGYRLSPAQVRQAIGERGWKKVVGFQTRNPIHRAHEYLTKCALETMDGLLLHPLVGSTKADDVPAGVRMRSYEVLIETYYPKNRVLLAVNPSNMYYAGPREAILHALVRKNFGCTHFIVGRDHAGVGKYYGPYDAQKIFEEFAPGELGISPLFFESSFYCRTCGGMASQKTCPHTDAERVTLSGTQVRELLRRKQAPPVEFSRPEIPRCFGCRGWVIGWATSVKWSCWPKRSMPTPAAASKTVRRFG
jgi:sulfate adenylyltransferase